MYMMTGESTCQAVEWDVPVNVTVSGNSFTKTSGGSGWNAGANSWQTITSGEGYAEVTIDALTGKIFGFGHFQSIASYQDIDFGVEMYTSGTMAAKVAGGTASSLGNVSIGDVVRVGVEYDSSLGRNVLRWYKNGSLLYTYNSSGLTITYPLMVDTTVPEQGSSITNAQICSSNLNYSAYDPADASRQPVEWVNLVNVIAAGSTITKTSGGNDWNASATSWQTLSSGEGYVEVRADAINSKQFGFTNFITTAAWQDLDFAMEMHSDGHISARSRAAGFLANLGLYSVGNILKVAIEYDATLGRNVIRWYRDHHLLYTYTNPTITYPLMVDTTINTSTGKFVDAKISGIAVNNPAREPADPSRQSVQWTNLVNVIAGGSTITKTTGGTDWNAGANSSQSISSGEGYVQMTVDALTQKIVGFTDSNTGASWWDIDFGVELYTTGQMDAKVAGGTVKALGVYAPGNVIRVAVEYDSTLQKHVVRWYRDYLLLYTYSNITITYPLKVDTTILAQGTRVVDAYISNGRATYQPTERIVAESPVAKSYSSHNADCNACPGAQVADPINAATGNAYWEEVDLQVSAPGISFQWARTYNSRDSRLGMLGRGWSSSLDMRLDLSVAGQVTVIAEGGAQAIYSISGSKYLPPTGLLSTLQRNSDGTFTFTRPNQSKLVFSSTGQLLSKADGAGRTVSLAYTSGRLSGVTDAVGRAFGVSTDSQGRVTQLTDNSVQRTVAYTYTGALLTEVKDVLGHVSHYNYTNNLLTSITYEDSTVRMQNSYDSLGRAVWQDTWNTTPITITYDVAAPPITPTRSITRTLLEDSLGRITAYDHDAAGRLVRTVDADGKSSITSWDANDRPLQVTDALGQLSTRTFDSRGNLVSERDATARGLDYTYDSANRRLSEKDALGRTSTYSYTTAGLLRQTTDALNNKTTYTYTVVTLQGGRSTSLLSSNEDALGRVTRYEYNNLAQPVAITNTLGQASHLEYDTAGRLTRSIDPAGIATCNEYDAANNLTATVANCVAGQSSTVSRNVRTEYGYDLLGRGTWTRNSLGEVSRTFYNEKGQVSKVVAGCAVSGTASTGNCDTYDAAHPELNRTTTFGYDDLGRQVSVTDTLGVVSRTEYDTLDRPTGYTLNYLLGQPSDPVTNITSTIEYDAAGRVSASLDALGRRSVPHYDNAGRVTEQITNYVDGNPATGTADTDLVSRTEYDAVGLPVTTTLNYVNGVWDSAHPDEDLRTVTRYDELGRTSKVIENYVDSVSGTNEVDTDRITEYRYDAVGNLVATIDPLGRVDVTIYDALNRPTTQIRNCTDSNGLPSTVSTNCVTGHGTNNDENIRTSTSYNSRGQVDINQDGLNRVVHTTYDPLGRVTEYVLNESGSYVPTNVQYHYEYTYTTLGYTVVITDPLQNVTKSEYNRAGWLVQQTDATNRAVTYSYDGLGRVIASTDALGHQTRTIYDALGRGSKEVANWQNGTVDTADGTDRDLITETVYDRASRRVAQVAPDGRRTDFSYDSLDRLISVTENVNGAVSPSNVTTSYSYDRRGLLASVTDANLHARSFTHSAAGWVLNETDSLNRTTSYTYDKAGRRLTKVDPRPVTVSYSYDKENRLNSISATNLTTISYAYDVSGRRTSMVDETGTTSYTYNGLDNLTQTAHSVDGNVNYGYDLLGRRTSLTSSQSGAPYIAFEYDAAGRLENVKQATGAGQPQSLVAHADYDAAGRLEDIERANGADTTYSYDNANRVNSLTTTQGISNTTLTDFDYSLNRLGQVTTASETIGQASRTITYTYDGLQRLTGAAESPGTTYGYSFDAAGNRTGVTHNGTTVETRTYDAANQVSNTGWQYDAAGNLLGDGTRTYTYDPLNRLTSIELNATTTQGYSYNGDGVLASESVTASQSVTSTRYVIDVSGGLPDNLGATRSNSLGSTSTWYIHGWGQELNDQTSSTTTWYLADRLSSTRATIDNAGGLLSGYNYDPYGSPEGSAAIPRYGFTGEQQSVETGLVYLRGRWYNPGSGRFQTTDKFSGWLTEPQSLHRYMYVNNDPVNLVDPTGYYACADDVPVWDCMLETTGELANGFLSGMADNSSWYVQPDDSDVGKMKKDVMPKSDESLAKQTGRFIAGIASLPVGIAEAGLGGGVGAAGIALCATVIGCVAGGGVLTVEGGVLIFQGAGTCVSGAINVAKPIAGVITSAFSSGTNGGNDAGNNASTEGDDAQGHYRELGTDPDRGYRFIEEEAETALRLEQRLGKRLERVDPERNPKHYYLAGDWVDEQSMKTYDAVRFQPQRFSEQWHSGNLHRSLMDHLRKSVDHVVVDLVGNSPGDIDEVMRYILSPSLSNAERAKLVILK
jgi:RHS repeat-associated protein